jgi:phospholipid/cholesterol/gamma-HCH transport system substrate-binding protein
MKVETKVGIMFLVTDVMVVIFAYVLGAINRFTNSYELNVAYNFAGGIEIGSPVRVMGIKVGKVKDILFVSNQKLESGEEVKLRLTISVSKQAWKSIRKDSRFYINLAGVIGEKFLEITPGHSEAELFKPGQLVRGEDPPRIDQLISQSYGLAGKILEVVEKNEGSVYETIKTLNTLVVNMNKLLKHADKVSGNKEVINLVDNTAQLVGDMAYFSSKMRSKEGQQSIALINQLIKRLEKLDGKAISKFLQDEGIKAKLF